MTHALLRQATNASVNLIDDVQNKANIYFRSPKTGGLLGGGWQKSFLSLQNKI